MDIVFDVRLDNGAIYRAKAQDNIILNTGDMVIVRKEFFLDYARIVQSCGKECPEGENMPRIQRRATIHDQSKAHENALRAKSSLLTASKLAERLKLPMKMLNSHYSFDGKLVTIQFTADGRVDFRELVKELSHALSARIELRQIGVRDETAIYGGIGVCGRALCCCAFLHEFSSINVKMAKEQDLSLTPSTISGSCGRLKCCLKYEHEGYLILEKSMPKRGEICECPHGRGKIVDRNLLTQEVVVQLESGNCVTCPRASANTVGAARKQPGKRHANESDEINPEVRKLED